MIDKDQDLALWRAWKKSKSPQDLDALMRQMESIIQREVNAWKRIAPEFLLKNEAKRLAIQAFDSYDPRFEAALGTHLIHGLRKLSRTAYARQSTLSVPEAKRLTFNNVTKAKSFLEDQYGRPATLDELSDHLRIPPKRIQSIVADVAKREFMESGDGPSFAGHIDDPEILHLAWHDMTPIQRTIFEHRTGYNGAPELSGQKIMKATNLTQGQLSHQIGKIKSILLDAQRLR